MNNYDNINKKERMITMRKSIKTTEAIFPMPVLMIATYNEDGSVNVMNAAWGTMIDRNIVGLNLTESHKTVKNIKERKAFTVSIADSKHVNEADYFEDIRPEEWVPSYAGKASRVDFLLKNEKVIIEVKKTRDHLEDKEIGDQLIIDIERYQAHPDCDRLICFVYDPEGRIGNPVGLKNDLENRHNGFLNIYILSLYNKWIMRRWINVYRFRNRCS